ncbi:DUF6283 family protein [Nocardia puris]|uniref:DUF6283 family protein n=1 Tax=Nocardia puris TaxID=208602 RepID=UPI001E347420|nr:DUF6283 family protein [Nocardia puris]
MDADESPNTACTEYRDVTSHLEMTSGTGDRIGPPAPRPCRSCPYRRDVPAGIWDHAEYEKLRRYDADTGVQPAALFQCHQHDGDGPARRLCAGWIGCHQPHLLAVRLAALDGRISLATAAACEHYHSPVPLFATGGQAADHGQSGITAPDERARHHIAKIIARRSDLTGLHQAAER